ncbi:MAG: cytochrome c [Betaproteobacteria bacterium]|nr:cytochrome c [Betaproteobacteria bacterium]
MTAIACRLVVAVTLLAVAPLPAAAASVTRGKALYESRCIGCHERSVHRRDSRHARSFSTLQQQVARWDRELGGGWSTEERDDVALYLNELYYRFPCPAPLCSAERAQAPRPRP